ncbi:hypothetical protein MA9V1_242 [Chryseobacterium phage MA9V-1]|nr:hypothetical protein MA9V1_242 [Chryseobacterium phage MA9V-1]
MDSIQINKAAKFVVDGHWFSRSRFSVIGIENKDFTFTDNLARDRKLFMSKLTMDLFAELRNLGPLVDQVVIVSDYISWRKRVNFLKAPWDAPVLGEDPSYKSQRTYDSEVNWGEMHKCFSDWATLMQQHFNIPYQRSLGCEGDDWAYIISDIYMQAKQNVILFSTDGDMGQLCRTNDNGNYTALYKKKRKKVPGGWKSENHLIATDETIQAINNTHSQVDVFSYDPSFVAPYEHFPKHFQEFHDILPAAFLLHKIIEGDGKDNVSPLMVRKTAKTTQRPKSPQIHEALKEIGLDWNTVTFDHFYREDFINHMTTSMHNKVMKMVTLPEDYATFYKNKWVENRNLLHLSNKEIPVNVYDAARKEIQTNAKLFGEKTNILSSGHYKDVLAIIGVEEQTTTAGGTDPFAGLGF